MLSVVKSSANAAIAGRIAAYFVGVAWLAKMSDSWSGHEGVCGSESSSSCHEIFLLISISLDTCINKNIYSCLLIPKFYKAIKLKLM
ncbi:MAG: hypothetical protein PHQ34_14800, partial [Methanothrix sp.]|nr:hypothetical protein [Methanothrix sp.]